jgi:uncharacterized protein (TIGR02588 family)
VADRKRDARDITPPLEWAAGAFGALVFCGMLGVLISTGLSGADNPPSISVDVERVVATENGYLLEFAAYNEGDVTAAAVEIVAELKAGGEMQERRARFDYLPPRSERRGGFFFETDPRQGDLRVYADGYNDP